MKTAVNPPSVDVNHVTLSGHVAMEPEKNIFALAVNRVESDGSRHTDFHRINYETKPKLKKGDKVFVEGKLRNISYETVSGDKRYLTEIAMENIEMFLTEKNEIGHPEGCDCAECHRYYGKLK